jgi:predicted nucleic acid-binding protein
VTVLTAFLDANVLFPAATRSVLLELARNKTYRLLWSDRVHDEWMRNLAARFPLIPSTKIARMRVLMEGYVNDATVSDYEPLISTLSLPDPDDCHVLAAAVHGGASIIVTSNLRDFPDAALATHGITAMTSDSFALHLLALDRKGVLEALEGDRADMRNPPLTADAYLAALANSGMTAFAEAVRLSAEEI